MDDLKASQLGTLGPAPLDSTKPLRKVSRLLFLWPLAGLILMLASVVMYPPLDSALIWWIGGVPCIVAYTLINIAWRNTKSGEDIPRFFPRAIWLAIVSLLVPTVLFLNGALDQSPVEQHRQVVVGTNVTHHRGQAYYSLEVESWRAGRAYEKLTVSEGWYLAARPGDVATVETHRGAFGIPLLVSVSVHRPD
jgi:hypothetical protein